MTTFIVTIWILISMFQGYRIKQLEREIEAIKSRYPFVESCKIRIPEEEDEH